jgi:hypothetical protein
MNLITHYQQYLFIGAVDSSSRSINYISPDGSRYASALQNQLVKVAGSRFDWLYHWHRLIERQNVRSKAGNANGDALVHERDKQ